MIVGSIDVIQLVCVLERGVPNKECIAFKVLAPTNLGQFGVMLGVSLPTGNANPIRDALYWFGDGLVKEGDWILLYTGGGEPRVTPDVKDGTTTYVLFWGRPTTLFANSAIVPILFRLDAVQLGQPTLDKAQAGNSTNLFPITSTQLRLTSDS
jgi:hypothetical protein